MLRRFSNLCGDNHSAIVSTTNNIFSRVYVYLMIMAIRDLRAPLHRFGDGLSNLLLSLLLHAVMDFLEHLLRFFSPVGHALPFIDDRRALDRASTPGPIPPWREFAKRSPNDDSSRHQTFQLVRHFRKNLPLERSIFFRRSDKRRMKGDDPDTIPFPFFRVKRRMENA